MALNLLFLSLTLLATVKTEEQDFNQTVIPASHLSTIPLHPNFQDEKFQGKWYSLASADGRVHNGTQKTINMHSVTYILKDDQNYTLNTFTFRLPIQNYSSETLSLIPLLSCDLWNRTVIESDLPGNFYLANMNRFRGVLRYSMKVADTDYNQFAVVAFTEEIFGNTYTFFTLYGRTKELSPQLKDRFVYFAKNFGHTDDNIAFHVPMAKCIDDY